MKLLIMIFAAIFGFFSWILSPFLPAQPERTEFLVDGVYQRFPGSDGEEKTVAKLMELAQAGDVDRVYEAFAPQVRDEAVEEDLRAQIQALLDFLSQQVTSRQEEPPSEDASPSTGQNSAEDTPAEQPQEGGDGQQASNSWTEADEAAAYAEAEE